jgi:MFS family permease
MDMSTAFQSLNWLAIICAALSTFLIGGIWYSPVMFRKAWMASNGVTQEDMDKRKMFLIFVLYFFLALIMAFNLAMFLGPKADIVFGMIAGFFTGFGWVFFSIAIIALFEKRSIKYILIHGSYMTVSFIAMGAILGAWH